MRVSSGAEGVECNADFSEETGDHIASREVDEAEASTERRESLH